MTRDERLILSIAVGASFVAFMNNTVITGTLSVSVTRSVQV